MERHSSFHFPANDITRSRLVAIWITPSTRISLSVMTVPIILLPEVNALYNVPPFCCCVAIFVYVLKVVIRKIPQSYYFFSIIQPLGGFSVKISLYTSKFVLRQPLRQRDSNGCHWPKIHPIYYSAPCHTTYLSK